jgi:CRISPR-associated protein Cas2
MYILITYDVDTTNKEGARRLRQVARACIDYGQRVQNSVFECAVTEAQLCTLQNTLSSIINHQKDSIRIYHLHRSLSRRVEVIGKETAYDVNEVIMI